MRGTIFALLLLAACGPPPPDQEVAKHQEEPEKQEEYDRAKRLERYYELEWVRCVNDLGIDRCKVIQETGFHQCKSWEFKDERGLEKCAARRLEDRLKTFPDEVPEEKKEATTGGASFPAEDPVHP